MDSPTMQEIVEAVDAVKRRYDSLHQDLISTGRCQGGCTHSIDTQRARLNVAMAALNEDRRREAHHHSQSAGHAHDRMTDEQKKVEGLNERIRVLEEELNRAKMREQGLLNKVAAMAPRPTPPPAPTR